MPVYSKPLSLHKGVDNIIQFQFINQEQKPVDITGKSIICRILKYDGSEVLISKVLTLQLPATGIAALELGPADIADIDPQRAMYSLEIPVGAFDYPVFVDQNAGARGDMNIVNSIFPSFIPSSNVSIPTDQAFPNSVPGANANSVIITYYTSAVESDGRKTSTFSIEYEEYYGNITLQGSTVEDSDWYPITTSTASNLTDTIGYNVIGYHPYIRIKFDSPVGNVLNVLVR